MKPRYPRIRYRGIRSGRIKLWTGESPRIQRELLARDVFRFAFYLPHDHPDIASGVSHSIDSYMRAVGEGPKTINYVHFSHDEGTHLTDESWSYVRGLLQATKRWSFPEDYNATERRQIEKRGFERGLLFTGGTGSRNGYALEYRARIPWRTPTSDSVSLLTATLPTEYLEAHGPASVRELALEMASQLRFASGHAGLALQLYWPLRTEHHAPRGEVLRHPGIDLRPAWPDEWKLGFRVDGVHWLNFFARPLLDQLGGAATLRSRLRAPGTAVREIEGDRVVVALGEWPEAGDLAAEQVLPAYRELARVLEPWLEPPPKSLDSFMRFTPEEARRWWRRFLD